MNFINTLCAVVMLTSMAGASAAMIPVRDTIQFDLGAGNFADKIEAVYVSGNYQFANPSFNGFADLSVSPVLNPSWNETISLNSITFIQATGNQVSALSFNIDGLAQGTYTFGIKAFLAGVEVASGEVSSDSVFTAVPEPATFVSGLGALVLLAIGARKRQ